MIIKKYYLVELRNEFIILNCLSYDLKGRVLYAHYCVFKVSQIDKSYYKYVISYVTRSKKGLYPSSAVPADAFYAMCFDDINDYIKENMQCLS